MKSSCCWEMGVLSEDTISIRSFNREGDGGEVIKLIGKERKLNEAKLLLGNEKVLSENIISIRSFKREGDCVRCGGMGM